MEEPVRKIGKNIFITVSEFKGVKYVDVRKYYEAEGEMKPTKKGISFNPDDWQEFVKNIKEIDDEITKRAGN